MFGKPEQPTYPDIFAPQDAVRHGVPHLQQLVLAGRRELLHAGVRSEGPQFIRVAQYDRLESEIFVSHENAILRRAQEYLRTSALRHHPHSSEVTLDLR